MKILISLLILGTLAIVLKKFGGENKEKKALENKAKEKANELTAMAHHETPAAPTPQTSPEPVIDLTKKEHAIVSEPANTDPMEAAYQAINNANANDVVAPSQALESIELPERLKHILDVLKLKLKFQKAKEEASGESKMESADNDGSENETDNDTDTSNDDTNTDTDTENNSEDVQEDNMPTNYDNENYGGDMGGGGYPFPPNPATIVAAAPATTVTAIKTPIQLSPIKTNIAANVANHLASMFNGVHLPPATPTPPPVINGGTPTIHVEVKGNSGTARMTNTNSGARVIRMNHHSRAPWKRH